MLAYTGHQVALSGGKQKHVAQSFTNLGRGRHIFGGSLRNASRMRNMGVAFCRLELPFLLLRFWLRGLLFDVQARSIGAGRDLQRRLCGHPRARLWVSQFLAISRSNVVRANDARHQELPPDTKYPGTSMDLRSAPIAKRNTHAGCRGTKRGGGVSPRRQKFIYSSACTPRSTPRLWSAGPWA